VRTTSAGTGGGEEERFGMLFNKATKCEDTVKRWAGTAALIVDEISMIDAAYFDLLNRVAQRNRGNRRPFGGMQVIDFLTKIRSDDELGDLPYVKEKALDFCRKQALKAAIEQSIDVMGSDTGSYESVVEIIKKAVSLGASSTIGHDFLNEPEARFVKRNRNPVPTGIQRLDSKGILNGGLGRGEMGVIVAATGVGKCIQRDSRINIRYTGITINGRKYKPWDRVNTKRGSVFARDVIESDELA
jgi:hypothetical protein